jgi:chloramphenicol 3-O-phosphotransferase
VRDSDKHVLALSGRTSAGKTTVADALSQTLGWPRAAFGDYVRAQAQLRGLSEERESLQELGGLLIEQLGWLAFCEQTLRFSGLDGGSAPCLVDGVRHIEALTALREIFGPVPVWLVYIAVEDRERYQRLAAGEVSAARAEAWELHPTEQQNLAELPEAADLVVQSGDTAPSEILAWLTRLS